MSVVVRLSRAGKRNKPMYRIVAATKARPRDGRFLEVLGIYDPVREEKSVVKKERLAYWVSKGAKVSDRVRDLLK